MEFLTSVSYDAIAIAVYSIAAVFSVVALLLLGGRKKRGVLVKEKNWLQKRLSKASKLKEAEEERAGDNILGDCYYYIPRNKYNLVTISVSAAFFLVGALFGSFGFLFIGLLFFGISRPVKTFRGITLPFNKFVTIFHDLEIRKKEGEVIESMSMLRNMLILQKDNPVGADVVIEQLMQLSEMIKPAFQKLLVSFRLNNHQAAFEGFVSEINTSLGRDYAQLLSSLDLAKPKDLDAVLESYQTLANEVRQTKQKGFDEAVSDLIYLPVMLHLMVILGNFVLVAYLIDQLAAFEMFF